MQFAPSEWLKWGQTEALAFALGGSAWNKQGPEAGQAWPRYLLLGRHGLARQVITDKIR